MKNHTRDFNIRNIEIFVRERKLIFVMKDLPWGDLFLLLLLWRVRSTVLKTQLTAGCLWKKNINNELSTGDDGNEKVFVKHLKMHAKIYHQKISKDQQLKVA